MGQQIFVKRSSAKVEENVFLICSVVKCRRTDGRIDRNSEDNRHMFSNLNFLD